MSLFCPYISFFLPVFHLSILSFLKLTAFCANWRDPWFESDFCAAHRNSSLSQALFCPLCWGLSCRLSGTCVVSRTWVGCRFRESQYGSFQPRNWVCCMLPLWGWFVFWGISWHLVPVELEKMSSSYLWCLHDQQTSKPREHHHNQ